MSGRVFVKSGARSLRYKRSLKSRSAPRRMVYYSQGTGTMGASQSMSQSQAGTVRIARVLNPEVKMVSTSGSASFNSTISSSSECYFLMPEIGQGLDDYQRIGDRVQGRYLYIKGYVQWDQSYISTSLVGGTSWAPPSTCRVMILSQNNINVGSDISSRADVAHLLKDNVATGTARGYSGTVVDNLAPINRDLFKVHMDRKVKLNFVGQTDAAGQGYATGSRVGNDHTRYFVCRIKMPSTIKFDTGTGNYANNFAPFICMGAVADDNSGAFSASTPYRLTWLSSAYFTDV